MTPTDFDRMLLATLADEQLSRAEKQALSQVIADESPTAAQLSQYRARAFEIARQQLGSRNAADLLNWLEEVNKALCPAPASPRAACDSHAHFSPDDNCTRVIIDLIENARKTIDICVFTITDDRISSAISRAHQSGVAVRIVTDNEKAFDVGSDIRKLGERGVPIRIDQTEHHMHHKFAVFDKSTLLNGSFNWTRSASIHNEENLIVTGDPVLVRDFLNMFEKLWTKLG